jgi:hypothetical protein
MDAQLAACHDEALLRHHDPAVEHASGHALAVPAVTHGMAKDLARIFVPHRAAQASALELHGVPPSQCSKPVRHQHPALLIPSKALSRRDDGFSCTLADFEIG